MQVLLELVNECNLPAQSNDPNYHSSSDYQVEIGLGSVVP